MSMIVNSLRKNVHTAYYDVVFEWENALAKYFHTKIDQTSKTAYFVCKAFFKLYKTYKLTQGIRKDVIIYFAMDPYDLTPRINMNGIPIFMDVWTDEQIEYIVQKTEKLQLFYCTSMEVKRRILEKNPHCKVKYMPLSISDEYYSENFSKYRNKSIDVIQVGRNNQVLHEYMMQYVREHPDVEYVYTNGVTHNELIEYVSTKRGNIGTIEGRENYIKALSSAKVSLVSTPAIDSSRGCANGNDFLTPRFYESAALGCAMVGRYGVNVETTRVKNLCPNITCYAQFVTELDKALTISLDELFCKEKEFIQENLTTRRAVQIENDIKVLRQNMSK